MTTPTGGTDITSLVIAVDAKQPEEATSALDQMGTAAVKAIKSLDDLKASSDTTSNAIEKFAANARAKTEALKEQERQTRELIKAEQDAQKAIQDVAEENSRFTAKLQEMIATFGMSKNEILAHTAAQIGATEAAGPLLQQIQALTDQYGKYGVVIKTVEQLELERIEFETNAAIVFQAFKNRTLAENAAAEEAASTALNAQRARALAEQAALEESAATSLAAFKRRTMAENRAAAIAEIDAMEAVRIQALEREEAAATSLAAFKRRTIAENAAALQLQREEETAKAIALAEKEAIEEIKWAEKSVKGRIEQLERLKAYQASGAISPETINSTFSSAAIRDLPNLTRLQNEYNESIAATSRAHGTAHGTANSFGEALDQVSFASSRARSELIVLGHEAVQGRFSRIPASMMVLAEYTNSAALATTGFGIAALAVIGILGAFVYETIRGVNQVKEFNDALNRTNDVSGATISSLTATAEAVGGLHGQYKEAYEASATLAKSGKFTADQIAEVTKAVVDLDHAFGAPIQDSIKEFETLVVKGTKVGASSTYEVTKAIVALDEKYHFLNASILEEIISLEKEGKYREASALAIKEYSKEGERAAQAAEEYMGTIERGWKAITSEIHRAGQALADIGKKNTNAQELARLQKSLEQPNMLPGVYDAKTRDAAVLEINKQILDVKQKLAKEEQTAAAAADKRTKQTMADRALAQQAVEDVRLMRKSQSELDRALATYHEQNDTIEAADPGYKERKAEYIRERELAIIKAHTEKVKKEENDGYNQRYEAQIRAVDDEYKLVKEATYDNERLIKDAVKAKVIDEVTGYEAMRKNRADELQALERWLKDRNDVIDRYKPKTKVDAARREGDRSKTDSLYENYFNDNSAASGKNDADQINAQTKAYDKLIEASEKATNKELSQLERAIERQKEHNAEIGKTKEQIQMAREARDTAYAAEAEQEAQRIKWGIEEGMVRGTMSDAEIAFWTRKMAALNAIADKQRELAALEKKGAGLEAVAPDKLANDAMKTAAQWKTAGDMIAKSLTESFGKAGRAAGDMFKAFATNQAKQLALNAELIRAKAANKDKDDEALLNQQAMDKYNSETARNRMDEYGNMANAAANFFDQGSRGYRSLMAVSQIFHAAETAMTIASLVPKALAAILTQGEGDPYTAFARMAAMTAVVAGLGIAVGGGGGVAKEQTSGYKQAKAGTGSVLGDPDEASKSIMHSLSIMEKNSNLGLVHTSQMASALKVIASGISGLTSLVVRNSGLTIGKNQITPDTTKLDGGGYAAIGILGGGIGLLATKIPVIGSVLTKLFGTTTSVIDQGITSSRSTLSDIQKLGLQLSSYTTTENKKKLFGITYSDKTKQQTSPLSKEINDQFTMVIQSLAQGVTSAADLVGLGGDAFLQKLNSFVVDIGEISTKGLTGTEIEEQFQKIFSKIGDDMAKYALSGLNEFQKVGEGYFETAVRVANDLTMVKDVFKVLGKQFNRTGLDAVKFSENLIDAAGGVDKLTEGTKAFVDAFMTPAEKLAALSGSLATAMAALGKSSVTTKEQFKQTTIAALDGSEAGNQLYAALIKLAPAFNEVAEAESEHYKKQLDIELQIAKLAKNETQTTDLTTKSRELELATMDDSLKALQMRKWALEDEIALNEKLVDANNKAYDGLKAAIDASKKAVTDRYNVEVDRYKKTTEVAKKAAQDQLKIAQDTRSALQTVYNSLTNALKSTQIDSAQSDAARRKSAQAYLQSLRGTDLTKATGLTDALSAIGKVSKDQFATFLEYAQDQSKTAEAVGALANESGNKLSDADRQIAAINDTIAAIDAASDAYLEELKKVYDDEMNRQDQILIDAKKKNDLLLGIDDSVKSVEQALRDYIATIAPLASSNDALAIAGGADPSQVKDDAARKSFAANQQYGPDAYYFNDSNGYNAKKQNLADLKSSILDHPDGSMSSAELDQIKAMSDSEWWVNRTGHTEAYWKTVEQMFKDGKNPLATDKSIPGYADGTNDVMGDQIIKVHDGERIMPKADNRELMSRLSNPESANRIFVAEVRELRNEVVRLRIANSAENHAIQRDGAQVASKIRSWDGNGMPTVRED